MDRQLLLLGLLRRQEMHGYQLNEFIEQKMHFCIDLKKPTAYYVLDKLAQQGYVRVSQEQQGNRPPRRVYHITPAGEAFFFRLLRQNLASHAPTFYPGDIGIAFMDQLPPDEVAGYLARKRDRIAAEIDGLRRATGHTGPLAHVLDRNRRLLQAELDWVDDVLERMKGDQDDKIAGD